MIDKTYFHAKIPSDAIKRGVWLNLSFDLISFFDLFKGQTFRSIDSFILGAPCKLRKIFTMKNPLAEFSSDDEFANQFSEANLVPKSLNFPAGVAYVNQLLNFDTVQKNCLEGVDAKEYTAYDESVSKNSTDVSQALRVRGLLSSMKDPKGNNDTANRMYGKSGEKKGLNTQQVLTKATNTLYSEQGKRSPSGREKDNLLQIIGVPKRNNLIASYDLDEGTPLNRSLEESPGKIINSPSRYEDEYEASQGSAVRVRNASEQPSQLKRTFSKDPKNRDLSPKLKRGQTNPYEETKASRLAERKSPDMGISKSKTKLEVARIQSDKALEKRVGARDTSKGRYDEDEKSPGPYSATTKKPMTDTKQSENPWSKNGKASASKLAQQISPKANMRSPRVVMNSAKAENKKGGSPLVNLPPKQKGKATPQSGQKESSKYPKEFEKTGFSDSSDRFNTTGRSFNQRYEGSKNDMDLFGPFQTVDEIESIEENLEYEMASNTSGMNGSRGFGDRRESHLEEPPNLVKISENSTLKTPQKAAEIKSGKNFSPNKPPVGWKKPNDKKPDYVEQQRVTKIEAVLRNRSDDLDDSFNKKGTTSASERNAMKSEEINKITNFENKVNHMASSLRPYSPPYKLAQDNNRASGEANKGREMGMGGEPLTIEKEKGNQMLEVVYDPTWNCYYHPETNAYYEMKE